MSLMSGSNLSLTCTGRERTPKLCREEDHKHEKNIPEKLGERQGSQPIGKPLVLNEIRVDFLD